jgi:N-acetylglucosamine-6-phosphate deacetylase
VRCGKKERVVTRVCCRCCRVLPEQPQRCKGVERAVLVTDAISATGMGDGRYKLGPFEVVVNGLHAESEGRLAGGLGHNAL